MKKELRVLLAVESLTGNGSQKEKQKLISDNLSEEMLYILDVCFNPFITTKLHKLEMSNEIVEEEFPGFETFKDLVEDLKKANREEQVFIIPIGIKYSYVNPPWQKIDRLLSKLEADSGLPITELSQTGKDREGILYQRVLRLAAYLISEMEEFYHRFYHQDFPEIITSEIPINEVLITRLHRLMDTAFN
jgi:hypothetical protein